MAWNAQYGAVGASAGFCRLQAQERGKFEVWAWIGIEKEQCYCMKLFACYECCGPKFNRSDMSLCHSSSLRSGYVIVSFRSTAWSTVVSDYFLYAGAGHCYHKAE